MHTDMQFDGQTLSWTGSGKFKGTTGLPDLQDPQKQCSKDGGPIPEGFYKVLINDRGIAKDDGSGLCQLSPGWGLQKIPRGTDAGDCEKYWANWGQNRARLEPADNQTRHACSPMRGGFYLHDSTKGYSHGCIEIEPRFFLELKSRMRASRKGYLLLEVKYIHGRATNGGTRVK